MASGSSGCSFGSAPSSRKPHQAVDEQRQHDAEGQAEDQLQADLAEGGLGVPGGRAGRGDEEQDDGQGESVVDAALDVQQLPQLGRDFLAAHDRRGEHRVGRREHGTDQERRRPVQAHQVVGDQRHADEGQRHAEPQRTGRVLPVGSQLGERDVHAVGEQHREQRQIGRDGHDLAVRRDVDQPEEAVADERAAHQEEEARWTAPSGRRVRTAAPRPAAPPRRQRRAP